MGSAGLAGLFWGIYEYRQSQKLRRQQTLFEIVKEFEKPGNITYAKKLLDSFTLEPREGWKLAKTNKDYYGPSKLSSILRDHNERSVEDVGELKIRESFDALLDFFGKLEYLLQMGLIKEKELLYFKYYIQSAAINQDVANYVRNYEFGLFALLVERLVKSRFLSEIPKLPLYKETATKYRENRERPSQPEREKKPSPESGTNKQLFPK